MQAGADEAKIVEVPTWRGSERFSPLERTALEYAEVMTITGQRVSDELFARLRTFFDESQIVELTAAVALENFRSKLNVPLGIEAQGFCVIPQRPSAPAGGHPRTDSPT
jgi:alkylhydroperoxidase family enzyme